MHLRSHNRQRSGCLMMVVAHPDDETIGAGALLSHTPGARVVHVTDGSPPDLSDAHGAKCATQRAYANLRRQEAVTALAQAGISARAIYRMQFTDQAVSFRLIDLAHAIVGLLREQKPRVILTHAYEGGHPDHDGTAFACQAAMRLLRAAGEPVPKLYEFAGYNGLGGTLRTYRFLPRADSRECRSRLSAKDEALKTAMLKAFSSQAATLRPFCPPQPESFRRMPPYDFTSPPHEGKLFYEHFSWGVDGVTWRHLAAAALAELASRGHET